MNNDDAENAGEIAAHKESLEYYKNILENLPALVFINEAWMDEKGNYCLKNVYGNKTAHELTGYSRQDCDDMGTDFGKMVLHPDDYFISQSSFEFHQDAENHNKSYGGPYRFKYKNGEYHWGIGFVKVIKPPDIAAHHMQFVNCLVSLTEAMQTDLQIQYLISENRRMGKESVISKISNAEMRVLKLIAKGLNVKEIANKLFISEATVSTHKNKLMKKLGLHSMAALAAFAISQGVV